jgi:hypothetical protein
MTRTSPSALLVAAVLGGAVGWFLQLWRVASGEPVLVPPLTLGIVLALIGVAVVLYAFPVFRVVRGTATKRVDPFYATRVVLLAKASSVTGAILGGAAAGVLVFLASRPVVPGSGALVGTIVITVGAVVLLVCGLVAEQMCRIPPDDDDGDDATSTISGTP